MSRPGHEDLSKICENCRWNVQHFRLIDIHRCSKISEDHDKAKKSSQSPEGMLYERLWHSKYKRKLKSDKAEQEGFEKELLTCKNSLEVLYLHLIILDSEGEFRYQ